MFLLYDCNALLFITHIINLIFLFFFFNDTATTEIYTLSLHDALPISLSGVLPAGLPRRRGRALWRADATSSATQRRRRPRRPTRARVRPAGNSTPPRRRP